MKLLPPIVFCLIVVGISFSSRAMSAQDETTFFQKGISAQNKGDFDLAMVDFDMAIQLNPKFAQAYFHRGCVYGAKGNYDKAIEDFN